TGRAGSSTSRAGSRGRSSGGLGVGVSDLSASLARGVLNPTVCNYRATILTGVVPDQALTVGGRGPALGVFVGVVVTIMAQVAPANSVLPGSKWNEPKSTSRISIPHSGSSTIPAPLTSVPSTARTREA